ncbi:hypothetical protein [Paraglaciecola sp.]
MCRNKLDIVLPQEVDYLARSAVTQARKTLGSSDDTLDFLAY